MSANTVSAMNCPLHALGCLLPRPEQSPFIDDLPWPYLVTLDVSRSGPCRLISTDRLNSHRVYRSTSGLGSLLISTLSASSLTLVTTSRPAPISRQLRTLGAIRVSLSSAARSSLSCGPVRELSAMSSRSDPFQILQHRLECRLQRAMRKTPARL